MECLVLFRIGSKGYCWELFKNCCSGYVLSIGIIVLELWVLVFQDRVSVSLGSPDWPRVCSL